MRFIENARAETIPGRLRRWMRAHGQVPLVLATLLLTLVMYHAGQEEEPEVDTSESLSLGVQFLGPTKRPGGNALGEGPLTGWIIAVDAGHGGADGGAVGRFTKTPEKGINLAVSLKLKALLEDAGASVVMTREADVMLYPEGTRVGQRKKADMKRRGEIVREGNAHIVLSIHMNEYQQSSAHGAQVFYQKGDEVGKTLASIMQTAMLSLDAQNKRQVMPGDFYMLRLGPPSVLIECGFMSNEREEKLLCTAEYQDQVAKSILRGVCDYVAMRP